MGSARNMITAVPEAARRSQRIVRRATGTPQTVARHGILPRFRRACQEW